MCIRDRLYLNGTFNYVYKDKWFDGFSSTRNAAKFVSREECELYNWDPITYQANDDYTDYHNYDSYYLVKPSYAMDAVDTYVEKVNGYGSKNVGMEDIGNTPVSYTHLDVYKRQVLMRHRLIHGMM